MIFALAALEREALLEREQDLADAEEADHRDQEVEALQEVGEPEGQPQLPVTVSMPTAASAKPSIIEAMVLNAWPLLMPTKAQKVSR